MSVEDDGDMLFCFDYLMINYPTAITFRFYGRFVHVRFTQTHEL